MEYMLVEAYDLKGLERAIQVACKRGWKPVGGFYERVGYHAHGMVREEARKVEVFAVDGTSCGTATFLHWGSDFEELPGGVGNFTMGVVEWPDGKVTMEYPPRLKFVKDEAPRYRVDL